MAVELYRSYMGCSPRMSGARSFSGVSWGVSWEKGVWNGELEVEAL